MDRKYVLRRLTPTECARLQGFPDWWTDYEPITELPDEEYAFLESNRKTRAAINGKQYKPIKRESMISWLNRLTGDSAKYKMWGNGIALPCAYDVLGRIAKELEVHNESD